METVWKVVKRLLETHSLDGGRHAVVILNQRISVPEKFLVRLWNEACFCVTVDGGTDRWYEFVSSLSKDSGLRKFHPDLISGDFDSIAPKTLEQCREKGVKVVTTPDQNKTDFHKALEEITKNTFGIIDCVFAIVENSGRLDHIMSNINTLYCAESIFGSSRVQLYILSSESLTWLLKEGSHTIHIAPDLVESKATCGLMPVGAPCTASTTGLKWNLSKDKMAFGGLISTCNTYSESCNCIVTVDTDSPLLWTMSLNVK